MKATIEHPVTYLDSDILNHSMLCSFNNILENIILSKDETELRKNVKESRYFKVGFGSHHLWVHQKSVLHDMSNIDETKRIIIVEF